MLVVEMGGGKLLARLVAGAARGFRERSEAQIVYNAGEGVSGCEARIGRGSLAATPRYPNYAGRKGIRC